MSAQIEIEGRKIGPGHATYIVAEMSANHNQDFNQAVKIVKAAKEAGADAVKLQTYTPDTITLDCDNDYFRIKSGVWEGKNLYELYSEAYTPWKWHPKLKEIANQLGMDFFSTPFDHTAVDFLEKMDVPVYKFSSFELVDIPLLRKIAQTGKPIIISTGMATLGEIDEAVKTIRKEGCNQLALLKCTSAYPASANEMNLRTIPHMAETFDVPTGLSDHTLNIAVPVAAVALGACIIEKHLTLARKEPGPDSAFSLEQYEFKEMVDAIRTVEKAIGGIRYEITEKQKENRLFRRSLFVTRDMKKGEVFAEKNVRSIRPGHGLHPKYFEQILNKKARVSIKRGTPLSWKLMNGEAGKKSDENLND